MYISFPTGVVAVTGRGVPLMPNGLAIPASSVPTRQRGLDAMLAPGRLRVGPFVFEWRDAESYDLKVSGGRGTWAMGLSPVPAEDSALAEGLIDVAHGFARGDVRDVASASRFLLGRGRGLTPEGDDLLVGAAVAAFALGVPKDVIAAVAPADLESRTTGLSATLLRLAADARAVEPLVRLLSDEVGSVVTASQNLVRVGSSTGRCYLRAVVAMIEAHRSISSKLSHSSEPREEVT